MRIRVAHDIERLARNVEGLARDQIPFATALTLTRVAQDAQAAEVGELPKRFTLRNRWLQMGVKIEAAKKDNLVSVVGMRAERRTFMGLQETGGSKIGHGHRVAVPVKVRRTKRDLIPASQKPKTLRTKPGVFVTKSGAIMRRTTRKRYPLQVMYWLRHGVKIKPRLGWQATTQETVGQMIDRRWTEAMDQATKTRR